MDRLADRRLLRFRLFPEHVRGDARNVAVVVSHLKQCSLLGSVPLQFVQVQFGGNTRRSRRLIFALNAAFGLVALLLLARVFFLAFGKTRSTSSWHTNLQSSKFGNSGWRFRTLVKFDFRQQQRNPRRLRMSAAVSQLPAGFPGLACVSLIVVASLFPPPPPPPPNRCPPPPPPPRGSGSSAWLR